MYSRITIWHHSNGSNILYIELNRMLPCVQELSHDSIPSDSVHHTTLNIKDGAKEERGQVPHHPLKSLLNTYQVKVLTPPDMRKKKRNQESIPTITKLLDRRGQSQKYILLLSYIKQLAPLILFFFPLSHGSWQLNQWI